MYGYSLAVREELAGTGVEVSVVMPAVVDTELAAGTSAGRTRTLQPGAGGKRGGRRDRAPALRRASCPAGWPPSPACFAVLPDRARVRVSRLVVPNQVEETDQRRAGAYEARAVERRA